MMGQVSMISNEDLTALKRHARFDLAEELCSPFAGEAWDDPAGVEVLQRIAKELTKGYTVTEVKPAKGIEAGCGCRFGSSCEISVLLGVERKKTGYVNCCLITRWFAPFFRRKLKSYERPDRACFEQWMLLCGSINDVIGETFGGRSVRWMTDAEASALWTIEQKES